MMLYFMSFPGQIARLRRESGTVSAIAGIFKAPMDIIADKLRGYLGLVDDLMTQPEKVLAACEALMPYLCQVAMSACRSRQERPDRLLDAPRLRAVRDPRSVQQHLLAHGQADH